MEDLASDNVKVYGVSYDPQSSLTSFVDQYDLSYDLLSDVDSEVIKKFGILNTLIAPEDSERMYGLPFPGVYVTDESGVVTEKFFYRHYASRASAGSIVDSALGDVLMPKEAPNESLRNDQVEITAFLADESLKFEYHSVLYVRLELEEGLHVYSGDLPDGYFATTVSIDETPGLRSRDPFLSGHQPEDLRGSGSDAGCLRRCRRYRRPGIPDLRGDELDHSGQTRGHGDPGESRLSSLQRYGVLQTQDGDPDRSFSGQPARDAEPAITLYAGPKPTLPL